MRFFALVPLLGCVLLSTVIAAPTGLSVRAFDEHDADASGLMARTLTNDREKEAAALNAYSHGQQPPPYAPVAGGSQPAYADKGVQTDPKKSVGSKLKSAFGISKGKNKARRSMAYDPDMAELVARVVLENPEKEREHLHQLEQAHRPPSPPPSYPVASGSQPTHADKATQTDPKISSWKKIKNALKVSKKGKERARRALDDHEEQLTRLVARILIDGAEKSAPPPYEPAKTYASVGTQTDPKPKSSTWKKIMSVFHSSKKARTRRALQELELLYDL